VSIATEVALKAPLPRKENADHQTGRHVKESLPLHSDPVQQISLRGISKSRYNQKARQKSEHLDLRAQKAEICSPHRFFKDHFKNLLD
jgi:hypothetical protein